MNPPLPVSETEWIALLQKADDPFEAIEEAILRIRNEVLNRYMVPVLLNRQLEQLDQLIRALSTLNIMLFAHEETLDLSKSALVLHPSIVEFLTDYESTLSAAKLKLMHATSPIRLREAAAHIQSLEYSFGRHFLQLTASAETFEGNISSREKADTGLLIINLRKENMEQAHLIISQERKRLLSLYS
jgi:hypothetical protein